MIDDKGEQIGRSIAKADISSPTLARRVLLDELRRIVRTSSRSTEQLAAILGLDSSTLTRWLAGKKQKLGPRDVQGLLVACGYGVADPKTQQLVALATNASRRGLSLPWMQKLRFDSFLDLEADAVHVFDYETMFVPGLLQTTAYAEMVIRALEGDIDQDDIAGRVTVRLQRQAALERHAAPLRMTAVLDETVLRRGPEPSVMRGQLEYLARMGRRPNVEVRIVPYDAGLHVGGETGPFVVMTFPEGVEPVAYSETPALAVYAESPEDVERYRAVMRRLEGCALDRTASLEMIERAASAV